MEAFYRGIETSLLALGFALLVTVAASASLPSAPSGIETTLPVIEVGPDADG